MHLWKREGEGASPGGGSDCCRVSVLHSPATTFHRDAAPGHVCAITRLVGGTQCMHACMFTCKHICQWANTCADTQGDIREASPPHTSSRCLINFSLLRQDFSVLFHLFLKAFWLFFFRLILSK